MDWTLAHQIDSNEHNFDIPFANHISLPQFPINNFSSPGVGLAAASNNYRFYLPVQGKTSHFDKQKVTPQVNDSLKVKKEQSGFGSEEITKKSEDILNERSLKRKILGDSVFDLMSSPKIKTVKLNLALKSKTKLNNKTLPQEQTGAGKLSKVHIFKK